MIQDYTIEDAYVIHANGDVGEKQLVLDVTYDAEVDGDLFRGRQQFVFPMKYDATIGDRPDLVGKKLSIMIQN